MIQLSIQTFMKGIAKALLLVFIFVIASSFVQAQANTYGVASVGYAYNEIEAYELDQFSYKFSAGYELSSQWYLEGSFQGLGSEDTGTFGQPGYSMSEFNALGVSALGKAGNQYGELFYRVGVMGLNTEVETAGQLSCAPNPNNPGLCLIDETVVAGILGLGFDLFIYRNAFVRFEVEYIQGTNDFKANTAYIGVRLNF